MAFMPPVLRPYCFFLTGIKCFENQHPLVEVSVRLEKLKRHVTVKYVRQGHVSIVEE